MQTIQYAHLFIVSQRDEKHDQQLTILPKFLKEVSLFPVMDNQFLTLMRKKLE